jgi:hypothetical protein
VVYIDIRICINCPSRKKIPFTWNTQENIKHFQIDSIMFIGDIIIISQSTHFALVASHCHLYFLLFLFEGIILINMAADVRHCCISYNKTHLLCTPARSDSYREHKMADNMSRYFWADTELQAKKKIDWMVKLVTCWAAYTTVHFMN